MIDNVGEVARQQIMQTLEGTSCNVPVIFRPLDIQEERKVQEFVATTCGCNLVNNGPCSSLFHVKHYLATRGETAELSWGELNLIILGEIMALTCSNKYTLNSKYRHTPKERERSVTLFHHRGHRVCRKTFLFLHGVGEFRLKAIKSSFLAQGVVLRIHGHTGRVVANAMVQHDVEEVVKFILQYAEANAILLPGRIPGYKGDNIEILPSSTTKRAVWQIYEETATTYSMRQVSYPTWCRCWSQFARHVVVGRPMSDLCLVCQQNSTAIVRSANLSEEEKSEVGLCAKV